MEIFKPSEKELNYICFIIKNWKQIFKPHPSLIKKLTELEKNKSDNLPQSASMPTTLNPKNTPKKAAKLLGLDYEQVSKSPIDLRSVQMPRIDRNVPELQPCDLRLSNSRVKLNRKGKTRPTIATIEQQIREQNRRQRRQQELYSDEGSPEKRQKNYDKLVDRELNSGNSPLSEYQNSVGTFEKIFFKVCQIFKFFSNFSSIQFRRYIY